MMRREVMFTFDADLGENDDGDSGINAVPGMRQEVEREFEYQLQQLQDALASKLRADGFPDCISVEYRIDVR